MQPSIPENPPAQSKDQLQTESANPLAKLGGADAKENKLGQVRNRLDTYTLIILITFGSFIK